MQEAKAAERLGSRRTGAETRPDGGGAGSPARGQSQASAGAGPEGETEVGSDGGARGVSKHSWQYRVARQTTLPRPCAASIHLGSGGNLEAGVAKQSAPSHAAGPGQPSCPHAKAQVPPTVPRAGAAKNMCELGKQPKGKSKTIVQSDRLVSSHWTHICERLILRARALGLGRKR